MIARLEVRNQLVIEVIREPWNPAQGIDGNAVVIAPRRPPFPYLRPSNYIEHMFDMSRNS